MRSREEIENEILKLEKLLKKYKNSDKIIENVLHYQIVLSKINMLEWVLEAEDGPEN